MYKAMLALHILTAIFAIGPLVHLVTTATKGIRNEDAGATATSARSATIYTFVSTVVVIIGFGLMSAPDPWADGPTAKFTEPFIWLSLILWLIAAVISLTLVVPTLEKATDRIRAGEAVADLSGRVAAGGGVIALLFAVIVVLMVYRPGS